MLIPSHFTPYVWLTRNSIRIYSVHLSSGPLICSSSYPDPQWLASLHYRLQFLLFQVLSTLIESTEVMPKLDLVYHQLLTFVNQSDWSNPTFVRYISWANSLLYSQESHVPSVAPLSAQFHPEFDLTLRPSCPPCFVIPLF